MSSSLRPVAFLLAALAAGCTAEPFGSRQSPVIGGDPVEVGDYPATGALVGGGVAFCTGTLISPTVVLTAGHCVDQSFLGGELPGFTFVEDANEVALADTLAGAATFQHPEFDINMEPSPGLGQWYDIGLVILAEPVEGVTPAPVATPEEAADLLVADATIELVGYGVSNQKTNAAGVKLKGSATLVDFNDHEIFIAEPGQQQNCFGDSGGPGFVVGASGRRLVGIVSRGPDSDFQCDHGGIDTRADAYRDWINGVLAGNDAGPIGPDAAPPDAAAGPDAGAFADGEGEAGCCAVAGRRRDIPTGAALLGVLVSGLIVIGRRRRR